MELVDIDVIGAKSLQAPLAVLLYVARGDVTSASQFRSNHNILPFHRPLPLPEPPADALLRRPLGTAAAAGDRVLLCSVEEIDTRLEDGLVHKVEAQLLVRGVVVERHPALCTQPEFRHDDIARPAQPPVLHASDDLDHLVGWALRLVAAASWRGRRRGHNSSGGGGGATTPAAPENATKQSSSEDGATRGPTVAGVGQR
mmetsp:Transcript_20823/g.49205  ORF Transcript_20823/g.49205 Transcript_20823/m.49205 type:complete len:200 (+) Transcript_20823:899-1498(+)